MSNNCRPAAYSMDMQPFLITAHNRHVGPIVSKPQREVHVTERYTQPSTLMLHFQNTLHSQGGRPHSTTSRVAGWIPLL